MRVNYRKKPGVVARLKKEIKDKTDRKRAAASKAAGSIPSIKAKRKTEKMREAQRAGLKYGGTKKALMEKK